MSKINQATLINFIKDNCANYYNGCLFYDSCKVLDGQRCGYFEKCVLGPPDYKFRLPNYDYAKLFAQYAEQTGVQKTKVNVRYCSCGTPLRNRQRYCDKCAAKKRRETKRKNQRKYRKAQNVPAWTVN